MDRENFVIQKSKKILNNFVINFHLNSNITNKNIIEYIDSIFIQLSINEKNNLIGICLNQQHIIELSAITSINCDFLNNSIIILTDCLIFKLNIIKYSNIKRVIFPCKKIIKSDKTIQIENNDNSFISIKINGENGAGLDVYQFIDFINQVTYKWR